MKAVAIGSDITRQSTAQVDTCVCPQVNSVSAREQLAQSIRDLTAALAERHASLTQALEATRQKRGEALAAQVSERRSLMEHAGLMAFTQELLKETDQPCFVQAARLTHNRSLLAQPVHRARYYVIIIFKFNLSQSVLYTHLQDYVYRLKYIIFSKNPKRQKNIDKFVTCLKNCWDGYWCKENIFFRMSLAF